MNLVIDLGNTNAKLALFENDAIVRQDTVQKLRLIDLQTFIPEGKNIQNAILSSVIHHPADIQDFLSENFNTIILDHTTPLPVKKLYKTPETLGNDRIAAAVGANHQFPGHHVLAIDSGTCITYDLVTDKNEYVGGNISPGLGMRFLALNTFTDKLPLVSEDTTLDDIAGDSTKNAIRLGVQLGFLEEIKGVIQRFREKYPKLKVVATGGNLNFFENELKNSIFADRFLILKGLNVILNHNAH